MNTYEIVTNRILESLKQGIIPWRKPWSTAGVMPTNIVSKKAYRGVNVMLLEGQFEAAAAAQTAVDLILNRAAVEVQTKSRKAA